MYTICVCPAMSIAGVSRLRSKPAMATGKVRVGAVMTRGEVAAPVMVNAGQSTSPPTKIIRRTTVTDIKIVFFDVDGTLLGHGQRSLPASLIAALKKARQRNVKLVICTGRRPQELQCLSDFDFDAFLTMNGQVCFTRNEILRLNPIPRTDIETLLDLIDADPFPVSFSELGRAYINFHTEKSNELYAMCGVVPPILVDDVRHEALTHEVYQLNFFTTPEHEREILTHLPGSMSRRWGDLHSDIFALSDGKKDGVKAALKFYGINPENALSFGDGENDIDMFELTAYSVAMGNASDTVKSAATYVTKPFNQGGILEGLTKYGVV